MHLLLGRYKKKNKDQCCCPIKLPTISIFKLEASKLLGVIVPNIFPRKF